MVYSVIPVPISRVEDNASVALQDLLATEEPLEIRIGYGPENDRSQRNIAVTMRTPGNDFELALGFLFTEGIIHDTKEIALIRYCTEANTLENKENIVRVELTPSATIDFSLLQRNFYSTSSCGVCGKESINSIRTVCAFHHRAEFSVAPSLLYTLPDKLRSAQNVFQHTGGLHATGLFSLDGDLLMVREDIGRHNAMDKIIGAALGSVNAMKLPLNDKLVILSGRAGFELIQKAAMAGIQFIGAVGAPSSLAVQMAEEMNITLVGFLRDNRFNIYTHPDRLRI